MRIDDKHTVGIGTSGLGRTDAAELANSQKSGVGKKGSATGPDKVNLSVLAERLQALEPGSVEQEQKLRALAAAFETGRYEPDPDVVSEALLDEAVSETSNPEPAE